MNQVNNAQTPAFPVMPVADKFGTVHVYPGQTKQEYLASQIFLQLFMKLHDNLDEISNKEEMKEMMKNIKETSLMTAEFFYQTEAKKQFDVL